MKKKIRYKVKLPLLILTFVLLSSKKLLTPPQKIKSRVTISIDSPLQKTYG